MGLFDDMRPTVDAMTAVLQSQGVLGPRPKLFMTSGWRTAPGDGPWHSMGVADDFGNDADQYNGSKEMDAAAIWVGQKYGPFSLEVIHTFRNGSNDGVYWKNGIQVDGRACYGDEVERHRGHLHWAITQTGLDAVHMEIPKQHLDMAMPPKQRMDIGALQKYLGTPTGPELNAFVDPWGSWGVHTDIMLAQKRDYYRKHPNSVDGTIKNIQALWGFAPKDQTGKWDSATEWAYNALRVSLLNK